MGVYLVTGGAGFIGSNLVAKLLHEGHNVHALDLNEAPAELVHPNLNWFQGDLLDAGVVAASLEGVDAIIHLAAQTSVPVSIAHPEMTHEVNVLGTELLLSEVKTSTNLLDHHEQNCSICAGTLPMCYYSSSHVC